MKSLKQQRIDQLVIGFALFSMFFGAGNIIFPPYLGIGPATCGGWGFSATTWPTSGSPFWRSLH